MTTTTPGAPTGDTVRAALVELLTTGQHHDAATDRRLAALTCALGVAGGALFSATPYRPLDTARLRAGLAELAAIALGWLDALPTPDPHDEPDPDDESPF